MLIEYLIIQNKSESLSTKNRGKSKGSSRTRKINTVNVFENNQANKKPPKYNIDISSFADIINKNPNKETKN